MLYKDDGFDRYDNECAFDPAVVTDHIGPDEKFARLVESSDIHIYESLSRMSPDDCAKLMDKVNSVLDEIATNAEFGANDPDLVQLYFRGKTYDLSPRSKQIHSAACEGFQDRSVFECFLWILYLNRMHRFVELGYSPYQFMTFPPPKRQLPREYPKISGYDSDLLCFLLDDFEIRLQACTDIEEALTMPFYEPNENTTDRLAKRLESNYTVKSEPTKLSAVFNIFVKKGRFKEAALDLLLATPNFTKANPKTVISVLARRISQNAQVAAVMYDWLAKNSEQDSLGVQVAIMRMNRIKEIQLTS